MKKPWWSNLLTARLFLAFPVVLSMIPEPAAKWVSLCCPGLLFTFLSAVFCGPAYALAIGLSIPFLSMILLKTVLFVPDTLIQMLTLAASGLACGIFYRLYESAFPAAVLGVLSGRIVQCITSVILYFREDRIFLFDEFLSEAFISCWPGLLLSVFAVTVLYHIVYRPMDVQIN